LPFGSGGHTRSSSQTRGDLGLANRLDTVDTVRSPNEGYEGRERQEYHAGDESRERHRLVTPLRSDQGTEGLKDGLEESEVEAERFDPLRDGPDLAYEHLHRYVLAGQVVEGLRVLDLAAGTGYGSSILARSAASLVSLDLESGALGSLAAGVCGDAQQLPFAEGSFDAVVCFEAIEHVRDPAKLVSEVKRVLAGPSILLISTPDREIYTDRAGHENPFHIAEMTRREFQRLLRGEFSHVRMLGQGLWAGSWIAGLAPGQAARGLGKRTVMALPAPESTPGPGSREQGVRWADPAAEELPAPVYLLAACADSKDGRLRLGHAIPQESILHDSSQWLLGQYDRLAQAWGGELASFRGELVQAKKGHQDQLAQIDSARASISHLQGQIEDARETIVDLEGQVAGARRVSDEREIELAQAHEQAEDQDRQLAVARSSGERQAAELETARDRIESQSAEIAAAQGSIGALESQISTARQANDDLDRQVTAARNANEDLESQVSTSGVAIGDLEAQVDAARTTIGEMEQEIETGRSTVNEMNREIGTARSTIDSKDRELAIAKAVVGEKDGELAAAKSVVEDKDRELVRAKSIVDDKDRELLRAKSIVDGKERELQTAREGIDEKEREIEEARLAFDVQQREIGAVRLVVEDKDRSLSAANVSAQAAQREIETLQAVVEAAEGRAEEDARRIGEVESDLEEERRRRFVLEEAQDRVFARIGGRIADWIDRWKGAGR
jgi:SAM-dependent methyltransferase/predicted  nucleic acid-binding Zn-ribbon protein